MARRSGLRELCVHTNRGDMALASSIKFLALLSCLAPAVVAQTCVSLKGSTQCPAFNQSSVSTDANLTSFYPFLAFVSSTQQFDSQLSSYVNSSYVRLRYQQLLGCNNVDLTNTTNFYARYTTSVICNSIVQNSIQPCSLSGVASIPLCAESCAQQATSEEGIVVNQQLCGTPRQGFMDQIRADFTNCALPADSLSTACITGEQNEAENCGFSTNLQGLCGYCASSSPNATDSCCVGSNVDTRCPGVKLPSQASMPPLFPSSTPTSKSSPSSSSNSNHKNGLSGGQIAGIVIGTVLGAALIIGLLLVCCFCIRRKRRGSQASVFNRPTPPRKGGPGMVFAPQRASQTHPPEYGQQGGRVARMSALENNTSSESPSYGVPAIAGGRRYGDTSESDAYNDTPESRRQSAPTAGRRNGSLSSQSILGALDDPSSPNTEGQISSPEGMTSGQSEQLPSFKDYYSPGEIHPNDKVSTLWAYQPRAGDEFELDRGDMLKVVGIWDDGWATGVRITDRAEDYDPKRKAHRDSGVSNSSGRRGESSPSGELKAFPLVCVCLPEYWKQTIQEDEGSDNGTGGPPQGLGS